MEKQIYYDEMSDGVRLPKGFPKEKYESVVNYKAREGDLFIVTYPRCGTTWMHHIVLLILRKGQKSQDPMDFFLGCPFLELIGGEYVEEARPQAVKTHLPYRAVPYSDQAKYIYVTRDPKDCCVSYFHFSKMHPDLYDQVNFDQFFQMFLEGNVGFGDYFEHVTEWYKHRNDKNVHIVTYESLKKDIRAEILKLARFIGEEYEKCMVEDPLILEDIVRYSSFEHMKENTNKKVHMFFDGKGDFAKEDIPLPLKKIMENMKKGERKHKNVEFVRKGEVGDWKNYFNENQVKQMEEKISEVTEENDFMCLWSDV